MRKNLTHKEALVAYNQRKTISNGRSCLDGKAPGSYHDALIWLLSADELWIEVPDEEPTVDQVDAMVHRYYKREGLISSHGMGDSFRGLLRDVIAEAVRQAKREVAEALEKYWDPTSAYPAQVASRELRR